MKIFTKNSIALERFEFHIDVNCEKYKDKPITIFNDYQGTAEELNENPINIIILNEPNEIFGLVNWVSQHQKCFDVILTQWDQAHRSCDNALLFVHGETNLDKEYIKSWENKDNTKRNFEVTFLSGILELLEGHKLRQKVLALDSRITTPHKWFRTLDDFDPRGQRPGYFEVKMTKHGNPIEGEGKKQVWDRNTMFHVAVESKNEINYFADKILDCFATKTLPIYYGASNISEFGYDEKGIIRFNDEEELLNILNNLTEEDYYSRIEAIENNYKAVQKNGFFFPRLELFLDELIEMNNL
tara:strand:+ start:1286 stop:2182 length:897 start_codon:yes stop_codon:yes gene_type:complete